MSATSFRGTLYDDLSATETETKSSGSTPTGAANDVRDADAPASARSPGGISVRLLPSGQSDAPVVANYVTITPSYGAAYLDFGFIEPGLISAVQQLAREGKTLPEILNGRLATRVALGVDVMLQLYAQLGQLLQSLQDSQTPR